MRVSRKVWTRTARHSHSSKEGDMGDLKNHREMDKDDCLFYSECFETAARVCSKKVCTDGCAKYKAQIPRRP